MNKSNHFTLMIIPEENGKTITFRIPKYLIYSLFVVVFIIITGLLLLLFKSGEIAAKLQLLSLIKTENDNLAKENDELRNITEKIGQFTTFADYLNKLAIPEDVIKEYNGYLKIHDSSGSNFESFSKDKESGSQKRTRYSKFDIIGNIPNILPVDGWITRHFYSDSLNSHQSHLGLDFAAALGTPIKSTAPGVIAKIENDKYFGLLVTVFHEGGFVTKYGHCSQCLVSKHERVKKGQAIALVGNTGRSSGPHLHYEVLKDGKNIDPSYLILNHKD